MIITERVPAIVAGTAVWSSRAKTANFGRREYSRREAAHCGLPGFRWEVPVKPTLPVVFFEEVL